jgi:glycosyltransferase involved in cell wall biosynthesis
MKILVLSPYPVFPPVHGGRVRTAGLARGLAAAGATVDVVCPWTPGRSPRPFRRDGVRYHPHFLAAGLLPLVLRGRVVPSLYALSLQPQAIGPRRLLGRFAEHDVFQFEFPCHARWMERVPPGALVSYSAHNVEADYLAAQPGGGAVRRGMVGRIARLERLAIRNADLVVTCTEEDGARLEHLYGRPRSAAIVPHGYDEDLRDARVPGRRAHARAEFGIRDDETALLFIGGPAPHNRDALRRLEHDVLPRLDPNTVLLAAGQCGGRFAKRARSNGRPGGRVVRLGFVDDLRPLLAAADLGVNPVTYGSGANLKLPAYAAAGLPTVSTPFGARGIEPPAGDVVVADPAQFADAVAAWSRRPAAAPLPRGASWIERGRALHSAYEQLLGA